MCNRYKIVLWGCGSEFESLFQAIRFLEQTGQIEVTGITSNQNLYHRVHGYPFLPKEALAETDFDLIAVCNSVSYIPILQSIRQLNISQEVINAKVFQLPGFNLEKYLTLKRSRISIFSNMCWGGITYNRLGLEFLSPLINMFESEEDYLWLMSHLQEYMSYPLKLEGTGFNKEYQFDYPICRLGDVLLKMNHYTSFEEAEVKWNKRKQRINYENIFVMMYTTSEETAARFVKLPFENKCCFVPFDTEEPALFPVNIYKSISQKVSFWPFINGLATGKYLYYDVLDLLLGKRTIIAE